MLDGAAAVSACSIGSVHQVFRTCASADTSDTAFCDAWPLTSDTVLSGRTDTSGT